MPIRPTSTRVHGDGLTSLQFRKTKGDDTEQIESPRQRRGRHPARAARQRRYIISAARFGEPFTTSQVADLDLGDDVYVGLFLCSHNPDVNETRGLPQRARHPAGEGRLPALSRLHRQPARGAGRRDRPPQRVLHVARAVRGAELDARRHRADLQRQRHGADGAGGCRASTSRRAADAHRHRLRDPQQQRPRAVVRRHAARDQRPEHRRAVSRRSTRCRRRAARRSASRRSRRRTCTAGRPTRSGWSTPAAAAQGQPKNSTSTRSPSDGSGTEIEADRPLAGSTTGRSTRPTASGIYFNSTRSGHMQIWRMKPDGSEPGAGHQRRLQQLVPALLARRQVDRDHLVPARTSSRLIIRTTSTCYLRLMPVDGAHAEGDRVCLRRPGHDQRAVVVARRPNARVRQQYGAVLAPDASNLRRGDT